MSATKIATQRLREALWAVAAASVVLTSTGVAGVHQTACPSAATANAAETAHQLARPGPGLLAVVRHLAQMPSASPHRAMKHLFHDNLQDVSPPEKPERLLQSHALPDLEGSAKDASQDSSTQTPRSQDIEQRWEARQEPLSDQALHERIARYRVSPEQNQRHAAMPNSARGHCAD
ncbi:MAG: hypothetical protein K9L32_10080 [Chromatiaceae bacterium]|nr:hypothetical protein [Chromatiaceae bacterium]